MAEPLLVVGLGNPGPRYETTRHNVGFLVADILAERIGSGFKVHKKSGAEVTTGRLGGRSVVLAKPRTYMNESGRHVGPLAKFYSIAPADVIVIDADTPWVLDRDDLKSLCKNTPFDDARFSGRVTRTIVGGRTVYEHV